MPSTTFTAIAETSFALLNVFLPGESVPNPDQAYAAGVANRMLSGWATRALMIPVISREVFDLTASKGGPSNPYTIGSGANLDTTKPATQNSVVAASVLLTASDPDVEVPLGIFTDAAYDAITVKELTSGQPTGLYYNPTYATTGFGRIYLWPVPDNATNDLVLYLQSALAQFDTASLGTTIYLPDGAEDAITYQLSKRLQGAYGKKLAPTDMMIATEVLSTYKRSNVKLNDLANDAWMFSLGRRTLYNVVSGSGG